MENNNTTLPSYKVEEIQHESEGMYPVRFLNAGHVEQERYDSMVKRDRQCYVLGATIEAKKASELLAEKDREIEELKKQLEEKQSPSLPAATVDGLRKEFIRLAGTIRASLFESFLPAIEEVIAAQKRYLEEHWRNNCDAFQAQVDEFREMFYRLRTSMKLPDNTTYVDIESTLMDYIKDRYMTLAAVAAIQDKEAKLKSCEQQLEERKGMQWVKATIENIPEECNACKYLDEIGMTIHSGHSDKEFLIYLINNKREVYFLHESAPLPDSKQETIEGTIPNNLPVSEVASYSEWLSDNGWQRTVWDDNGRLWSDGTGDYYTSKELLEKYIDWKSKQKEG